MSYQDNQVYQASPPPTPKGIQSPQAANVGPLSRNNAYLIPNDGKEAGKDGSTFGNNNARWGGKRTVVPRTVASKPQWTLTKSTVRTKDGVVRKVWKNAKTGERRVKKLKKGGGGYVYVAFG